jgi:hypothetical protein
VFIIFNGDPNAFRLLNDNNAGGSDDVGDVNVIFADTPGWGFGPNGGVRFDAANNDIYITGIVPEPGAAPLLLASMGAARHLAIRCAGRRALDPGSEPDPTTSTSTPPLSPSSSSVADPEARRVLALLREATELVYRVHDLVEGARAHMGAAESLLLALGLDEDDDGGRDRGSAPWVHPPCVAEQLDGTMDLGEAFARALDLLMLTTEAGEAAFRVADD